MAIQLRERIRVEKKAAALAAYAVSKAFRPSRVVPGGGMTVRAVDCVSLSVWRGEIYGLLGANGSGKSTLIRLFSTLLTPDEGTVSIFGLDIDRDELAVKRLINRVSVEASFFKKLSAMENLVYAGRLYGVPPDESRSKVVSILRRLGIEDARMKEPLEKLSRGMQQKVAIARALLTTPGLDEAARLADRIGILHHGRLVAEGTPEELAVQHGGGTLEDVFMTLTGRRLDDADATDAE